MITEDLIWKGYNAGVIKLIDAPDSGEVVCQIGDYWFYFWNDGPEMSISRNELLRRYNKDQIVHAIWMGLDEFKKLWSQFGPEYIYYEVVLSKSLAQELSPEQKHLREQMHDKVETEMASMFPACYADFPESFINDVVKNMFTFSGWQRGEYSSEDIRSAIQRVVLDAVNAKDIPPKL